MCCYSKCEIGEDRYFAKDVLFHVPCKMIVVLIDMMMKSVVNVD